MAEVGAAAAGLPAFFEFALPPAWQAIDFIADLHLSAAMPHTFEAWGRASATHPRRCGVHPR